MFDKKSATTQKGTRSNFEYQQLAEELHKPNFRKLKKLRVNSSFKDNIASNSLADMQLISKYNMYHIMINVVMCIYNNKYNNIVMCHRYF